MSDDKNTDPFEQAYHELAAGAAMADLVGLSTGLKSLDGSLMGLRTGTTTLFAGWRLLGKTSLVMNIALNVAMGRGRDTKPHNVCFFSLDEDVEECRRWLLCTEAGVSHYKARAGYLTEDALQRIEKAKDVLATAPLTVCGHSFLGLNSLIKEIERQASKASPELVIVDSIQRINVPVSAYPDVVQSLFELRRAAQEYGFALIVVSELCVSEHAKDKTGLRASTCDLGVFGNVTKHVDAIGLLDRPCKFPDKRMMSDEYLMFVEFVKNRFGRLTRAEMNFDESTGRIFNRKYIKSREDENLYLHLES